MALLGAPRMQGEDERDKNIAFHPLTLTLSRRERGFFEVP